MIIIFDYINYSFYLGSEIIQPGHIPRAPLVLSPILTVECKIGVKESESMYIPQDNQQKKVARLYIHENLLTKQDF